MFDFQDAQVVKRGNPGRKAEPNPFEKVIKEIALKVDPTTEKPVAKSFIVPSGKWDDANKPLDDDARAVNKYLRQLGDAGLLCDPQVTVNRHTEEAGKGKVRIVFWTIPKVRKPRNTETADNA